MSIETNISTSIKRGIIIFTLIVLFFPIIKQLTDFEFENNKPLDGSFSKPANISFSWEKWFNGEFTNQKDEYLKGNFGLHDFLVRSNNELEFNLFKKVNASGVVIGKDMFLFESPYIDAYYGRKRLDDDSIEYRLNRFKQIQDTLAKQNKLFLLVLAPGKASFYPEYIPDNLKSIPKLSNYDVIKKQALEKGLNTIDFNKYFVEQKNKSKYPLYPKYGIHWSYYGNILAFDSILKYVEAKLKVDLPNLETESIEVSDSMRYSDDDLLKGMNLLGKKKHLTMAYPKLTVKYEPTIHKKLNIIVVADSYWWVNFNSDFLFKTFNGNEFWYYNEELYSKEIQVKVVYADHYKRINNADIVILLQTEATLRRFGFNFENVCYNAVFNTNSKEKGIQKIKEQMVTNSDWHNYLLVQAKKDNIPIDSVIQLNAEYMYSQSLSK